MKTQALEELTIRKYIYISGHWCFFKDTVSLVKQHSRHLLTTFKLNNIDALGVITNDVVQHTFG